MNQEFEQLRKRFLENYKKACPIMTVLGDEVRQEIFLILIQTGGRGGIRVGDIQKMGHISLCSFTPFKNHVRCRYHFQTERGNEKLLLY